MKKLILILSKLSGIFLLSACQSGLSDYSVKETANRAAVEASFLAWQNGTGSPFDLLAEDMEWTIIGSSPRAGTFRREQFLHDVVAPFNALITAPLKPTQWKTFAEDSVIIIRFSAETRLKNSDPYKNDYAWFFTFEDGKVSKVTAFLDLPAFERALETGK